MSERPTPETDSEVGYFDLETAVSADFARKLERERDEAREVTDKVIVKAKELIARWDEPSWKDTAPTARYINALRIAVRAYEDATRALGDVKHDPVT